MAVERLPPSNVEAEEAVLGSLLIDPEAILKVASFLIREYFYREKNGWIYEAIRDLYERREPVDFLTVCDELERRGQLGEVGGPGYLTALINAVPTAIHVEHYAHIVERTALRRRLIAAAGDIARIAYEDTEEVDETIDRAEQILFSVSQQRLTRYLVPIRQLLGDYFDQIEYLHQHQGELSGIPTGFTDLDKILGGLQPSDLIIVAGRPGMGKTSFVLSIAQHMAIHHKDMGAIAIFSLEMGAEQVAQRLISSETGIDSQRLRLGRVRDDEIDEIVRAIGRLSETAIFIDDTPAISPLELRTKARRLHAERPLGLVIVDYLQLMQAGRRTENRVQEISLISRSLKSLGRELKVPVMAASQLSRAVEGRQDKHPILSDLRESGSIEQDADVVMFIYRDEMYHEDTVMKNIAEISVAKHRNGPVGKVELAFIAEQAKFMSLYREPA